jgi:hypothetical protein
MFTNRLLLVVGTGLLLVATRASTPPPSCDKSLAEVNAIADASVAYLKAARYTVVEGQMKAVATDAFGANVGNPYIVYFHPTTLALFELRERSAVIFVGCTPSAAAYYFSWRSYAFTAEGKLVFASLGDSLNNQVTCNRRQPGRYPFERTLLSFRQKVTLEDAVGSHTCSLEASMRLSGVHSSHWLAL